MLRPLLLCLLPVLCLSRTEEDPHAAWRERLVEDGRPRQLEDLSGLTCAQCHQAITAEWRHSTHATAWVDPHFQAELKKIRKKPGCTGCHAPEPLFGAPVRGTPKTRKEDPHLGVTCTTCHLAGDGKTVLGPAGRPTQAHPSETHELFQHEASSALCVSCHDVTIGPVIGVAKDWAASDLGEGGESCVSCHMPSLTRPWANGEDGTPLEERRGRSHRIEGPRDQKFLAEALQLVAQFDESLVTLAVTNLTGHRVPGLIGRELEIELTGFDEGGAVLARLVHRLDHRTFLPLDRPLSLFLEGARIKELRVRATHKGPGFPKGIPFLEQRFTRQ